MRVKIAHHPVVQRAGASEEHRHDDEHGHCIADQVHEHESAKSVTSALRARRGVTEHEAFEGEVGSRVVQSPRRSERRTPRFGGNRTTQAAGDEAGNLRKRAKGFEPSTFTLATCKKKSPVSPAKMKMRVASENRPVKIISCPGHPKLVGRTGVIIGHVTGLRDWYWVKLDDHDGPPGFVRYDMLAGANGDPIEPLPYTERELWCAAGIVALLIVIVAVLIIVAM